MVLIQFFQQLHLLVVEVLEAIILLEVQVQVVLAAVVEEEKAQVHQLVQEIHLQLVHLKDKMVEQVK